jgi:glycerol uptake facilitator protein
MSPYLAELIGTMMLVLLGNGVCANVSLNRTKAQDSGWIVIATGWALAVTFAVYLVNHYSGAHLNPAVTLGLAMIGKFDLMATDGAAMAIGGYITAQLAGGILGGTLVWLAYLPHWKETEDVDRIRGSFCNSPAIPNRISNLLSEIIGTFTLMLAVVAILVDHNLQLTFGYNQLDLSPAIGPPLVGITVWAVGLSLGGPTGYAINPARDLGPRIAHAILPIANKGHSHWDYSWIPVVGPILGGLAGAFFYQLVWPAAS